MTGPLDPVTVATAFLLVFPAELPDKTFIATLVLSTRFPRLLVWLGVAAAFLVQCVIAVTAGGLLALLPERLVLGITSTLFAVGAVLMLRSGLRARTAELAAEQEEEQEVAERAGTGSGGSRLRAVGLSFVVLFTAEWGDLSQLLTAGLAARTDQPVSVLLGAWTALALVAGIAVAVGGWLRARVPLWRIRLLSGALLAVLAAWTLVELLRG